MLPALLLPFLSRSAVHPNERADFFVFSPVRFLASRKRQEQKILTIHLFLSIFRLNIIILILKIGYKK